MVTYSIRIFVGHICELLLKFSPGVPREFPKVPREHLFENFFRVATETSSVVSREFLQFTGKSPLNFPEDQSMSCSGIPQEFLQKFPVNFSRSSRKFPRNPSKASPLIPPEFHQQAPQEFLQRLGQNPQTVHWEFIHDFLGHEYINYPKITPAFPQIFTSGVHPKGQEEAIMHYVLWDFLENP